MKAPVLAAALVLALAGAASAATVQPALPMNGVNNAFYVCGTKATSFVMSYDGPKADRATMTTATHKTFNLKATPVSKGRMFSGDGVKFWTDGSSVVVDGAPQPYRECKYQS